MITFPEKTKVGKIVPKTAFYKHLEVNTRMKRIFVNDVEKIVWANKFAPSTVNVKDGTKVHEITVFFISVKSRECPNDIFVFIDKNFPRHTVFILSFNDEIRIIINYKEQAQSNSGQPYKIVQTYQTQWMNKDMATLSLEGSTMDYLYESLVRQVAGERLVEETSSLKEDVEFSQQQESLKKQIAALKKKLAAENQPQRKFTLHKQLKELEKQLKA